MRFPYLEAKAEERKLEVYGLDLLWLNVKGRYENLPRPSEIASRKESKDVRSAQQIKDYILKRLKG